MNWIDRFRLWTQDLYLACAADSELPSMQTGPHDLRDIVRRYTQFAGNANAPPSLRAHQTRGTSRLNVRPGDYSDARQRFKQRLARSLLLDLDVLQDEILLELIRTKNLNPTGGIESYINQLGADFTDIEWARYRCVELSAVRNCITHNGQTWDSGQINRLTALTNPTYAHPIPGDQISIELAHLFAYKTAVRHVLTRSYTAAHSAKDKKPSARGNTKNKKKGKARRLR